MLSVFILKSVQSAILVFEAEDFAAGSTCIFLICFKRPTSFSGYFYWIRWMTSFYLVCFAVMSVSIELLNLHPGSSTSAGVVAVNFRSLILRSPKPHKAMIQLSYCRIVRYSVLLGVILS